MAFFRRSSNSPRYFAPASIAARSSETHALAASGSRARCPPRCAAPDPSTMADLPTPGSPMSTGLFLRAARQNLDARARFRGRARSPDPARRCAQRAVRSRENWFSTGVSCASSCTAGVTPCRTVCSAAPRALCSDPVPIFDQDMRGHALALAHQRQQQMLYCLRNCCFRSRASRTLCSSTFLVHGRIDHAAYLQYCRRRGRGCRRSHRARRPALRP